ncbi:hypothetical protein Droror1_Dr00015424 [Drosera rotundifolia]
MVFKGTWALQGGLSLYTDEFGSRGCKAVRFGTGEGVKVDARCDLEEDRCGEAGWPLLAGLDADDTVRRPVSELEMD